MSEAAVPVLAREIAAALAPHGFKEATWPGGFLLKLQTLNINRAVVVLDLAEIPPNLGAYLKKIRKQVAFACGFFPFFWGIGIQVVLIARGGMPITVDPADYISDFDNQWAIIQSIFIVDVPERKYHEARSWGQVITGKYQDAIAEVLRDHLTSPQAEVFGEKPFLDRSFVDRSLM